MHWRILKASAIAASAALVTVSTANAQEGRPCWPVTRSNLVPCAESASYTVKAETYAKDAADGRRLAVSPLLPSNPVLSFLGGRRWQDDASGHHWSGSLAQEVEIAGQRGLRRDAAQAEVDAQSKRVLARRREVARAAWTAYFDAVAARKEQALADRLATAAQRVADVARAKAEKGLLAPVDGDVADALSVRILQAKLAADRRAAAASAALLSLLGLEPSSNVPFVEGELVPVDGLAAALLLPETTQPDLRPEVQALDAERRAFALRADALRRSRVPNPTLSIFGESDRFEGRVLAAGISVPIPIPGNLGRTNAGEIAEAEALSRQAGAERERARREIALQAVTLKIAFESLGREVQAFTPARVSRAEQDMRSLAEEIESGRLAVRDVVVTQQVLIDLLQANVAARRAWCLASVELALALGVYLEAGAP